MVSLEVNWSGSLWVEVREGGREEVAPGIVTSVSALLSVSALRAAKDEIGVDSGDDIEVRLQTLTSQWVSGLDSSLQRWNRDSSVEESGQVVLPKHEDAALIQVAAAHDRYISNLVVGAALGGVGGERDVVLDRGEADGVALNGVLDDRSWNLADTLDVAGCLGAVDALDELEPVLGRVGAGSGTGNGGLAGLEDGGAEWWVVLDSGDERIDGEGTGGLTEDGHLVWSTTKGGNVALDPVEGETLVVEAQVAILTLELWGRWETKDWRVLVRGIRTGMGNVLLVR